MMIEKREANYQNIDNLGRGHCGFYALAIAIIDVSVTHHNHLPLDKWIEYHPEIQEIIKDVLQQISIVGFSQQWTLDPQVMNPLMWSLRKLLFEIACQHLRGFRQAISPMKAQQLIPFLHLQALFEFVENGHRRTSNIYTESNYNPMLSHFTLVNWVKKLSLRYQHLSDKTFLLLAMLNFNQSLFVECYTSYLSCNQQRQVWQATANDLGSLASFFGLEVNFVNTQGQLIYNQHFIDNHALSVTLQNHANVHWTTCLFHDNPNQAPLFKDQDPIIREHLLPDEVLQMEQFLQDLSQNPIQFDADAPDYSEPYFWAILGLFVAECLIVLFPNMMTAISAYLLLPVIACHILFLGVASLGCGLLAYISNASSAQGFDLNRADDFTDLLSQTETGFVRP